MNRPMITEDWTISTLEEGGFRTFYWLRRPLGWIGLKLYFFLESSLIDVGGGDQPHVPAASNPEKTRYPLYRRLGGPQGRSVRAENLVPTGIQSRTFQPGSSVAIPTELPGPHTRKGQRNLLGLFQTFCFSSLVLFCFCLFPLPLNFSVYFIPIFFVYFPLSSEDVSSRRLLPSTISLIHLTLQIHSFPSLVYWKDSGGYNFNCKLCFLRALFFPSPHCYI